MVTMLYKWLLISLLPFGYNAAPAPKSGPLPAESVSKMFHPFFVSVTEINHNSKEKTLEISCKLFSEDLEDVLKQNYKTAVDVTNEKQHPQVDKLVNDYVQKHLALGVDGKPVKLNYVGFEKEAESVYCYFEVPNVANVKKVDISNSILQDFSDKQINIIHVIVNGNRKSYKLDYPQKQAAFAF